MYVLKVDSDDFQLKGRTSIELTRTPQIEILDNE